MARSRSSRRVIKEGEGGHGHHGGAWKIADDGVLPADVAAKRGDGKVDSGIANYFAPTSTSKSESGAGGMLGGKVIGEGMLTSNSSTSFNPALPPPTFNNGESDSEAELDQASLERAQHDKEQQQFEETADELRQAVSGITELKDLAKNLLDRQQLRKACDTDAAPRHGYRAMAGSRRYRRSQRRGRALQVEERRVVFAQAVRPRRGRKVVLLPPHHRMIAGVDAGVRGARDELADPGVDPRHRPQRRN